MNVKDELKKLRNIIVNKSLNNENEPIDLNDKIDRFIEWYDKSQKGRYTDIGEFHKPYVMRNFIEKMAVWYELRYPDYEIDRLMHCSGQDNKEISNIMFNKNEYINELFDAEADIRTLDWDEFYNTRVFINSLSSDEKHFLLKARDSRFVYLEPHCGSTHLLITSSGYVIESEEVERYTKSKVKDNELNGLHITNVVQTLREKGISLPSDNDLEKTIRKMDKWNHQREEMLNCVMYRIIERGGNRIGPRRAFQFAKEFKRNIDIPMMYGVDYSDPGLRKFMIEYMKAGGSKDLVCYIGYFSRANKKQKMSTVSIQEMMKTIRNNCITKYTPEETELHQRLINVLTSQIDPDKVRKEEGNQLKIEKKTKKNRGKCVQKV